MKERPKLLYFFTILVMGGFCMFLSGCKKIAITFPDTPVITWKSATVTKILNDSDTVADYQLKLIISFTDGNGDIGLGPGDTTGVFSPKSPYYYNLWVGYYEKYKDSFIHITQSFPFGGDTIKYNGRIPVITPEGKLKAITGDIEYDIDLGSGTKSGVANTIKFDFILLDKALNKSNKILSPPIVLF